MDEVDGNAVFIVKVFREVLGAIDGAVLAASTAESHLEVGEVALDKALHVMVDKGIDGLKEGEYLAVLLEEVDDGLVQAREGLVLLVLARVVSSTAVEDIPAAVAGGIFRSSLLKGERVDRY